MARKRYVIATQNGYLNGDYPTKAKAAKALAAEVKAAASECRRSKRRCTVKGSTRSGFIEIKIGGRQGHNLWQRYVINERGW